MKSIFSTRRNKSPHTNEGAEKSEGSFFSKESKTPFFNSRNSTVVQTKLTIGQPGDKYEKEADTMADAVVTKSSKPAIQNKKISSIQRESLATPQEDEKLGTAEQRMEEDKLVQEKPEIQRMEEPEEEMLSKMDQPEEEKEGMISKMEGTKEEEEPLQTKSDTANATASAGLSQQLKSKSGTGQRLSKNTRAEMESSFGRDFSDVNIHTDADAVKMNKELGAQAFTHGKDVYFNSGKYNPDSTEGKRLLAHELTHTIQQGGIENGNIQPEIQRYGGCNSAENTIINSDHSTALSWLNGAIANLASYNGTTPANVQTALSTHFGGSDSRAFGYWVMTNLIYLRSVAWMAGYQCETTGKSFWACTAPSTLATTFWCVPGVDVRICPGYFTSSTTDRVSTLIHEWVHKYGCNFDLGYEHESGYSGNGTVTQLLNADSFANFVRDAH